MAVTISITRGDSSLLEFSDTDGPAWGILPGFLVPAAIPNVAYASSPFHHGATAVQWSYQQAFLQFDANVIVDSASDLTDAMNDVKAQLGRLDYTTTVDWNGEVTVWSCNPGTFQPAALGLYEASENRPTFSITIPCYPIPA